MVSTPINLIRSEQRDVFLSHRSVDKEVVRRLAGDIETGVFGDRNLLCWVDEAEIRGGQSVTGTINLGLENSRFVALGMTPAYFESESGWTDAEWHAALYVDPDNRKGRILPLLISDCPYIPVLLRHLHVIDLRGNRYEKGLKELLSILREEPLRRPVTHRGQLVSTNGRISRLSLLAERAVPDSDPDVVSERLYCNLLPVERLPRFVYTAKIADKHLRTKEDGSVALPSKAELKEIIREEQVQKGVEYPFTPAFRMYENRIITFHDLEAPDNVFSAIVDDSEINPVLTIEFLGDEDERALVVSLLNMAVDRHMARIGLTIDETKQGRFFFPPENGGVRVVSWIPTKRRVSRTVAKPCIKDNQTLFWIHMGAYLRMIFIGNRFYIKIKPTWVITEDGNKVRGGPKVGRVVMKWTGPERNLQILYHVRFWTAILRSDRGPLSIRAGDQWIEVSSVPAFIDQSCGISEDQKDLLGLLDQEAELIAREEEALTDLAVEAGLEALQEMEEDLETEDVDEESSADDQ
jgi:hypothetical protein